MIYIELPDTASTPRPLPFYLAMEEWAARHARGDEEYFFMWQVDRTVIFGRNQMMETELDTDYCRHNGIALYRRKSGGGCVFADLSNIMFSHITPTPGVVTAFESYTSRVTDTLRALGLDANANSRNDILIGSRKVSGNAFYRTGAHSIVHGTMLYDTDMGHMTRALTPSAAKLRTKGVESVRSRVTTIREHLPSLSIDDFKRHVRRSLCADRTLRPGPDDIAEIEALARPYFDPDWIHGRNPRGSLLTRGRIEGVGEFEVSGDLDGGRIRRLSLAGDFFAIGDIDRELIGPLIGAVFTREGMAAALSRTDLPDIIAGLTVDRFIAMIFD